MGQVVPAGSGQVPSRQATLAGGASRIGPLHHHQQGLLLGHQDDRPGLADDHDGPCGDRHRRRPGEHVELPLLASRHALGQPDGPAERPGGGPHGLRRPVGCLLQQAHGHPRLRDGRRVRLHPPGSGRVGRPVPAARRRGHESRQARRRDLPRGDQEGQGRRRLRQGRGTAARHHPGSPGQASPRLQPQEHRHRPARRRDGRQRPRRQRRRRRLSCS